MSHKSVEKEQNEQSNKDKNENLQQLQDKITKLEDELDTTRIELQETQVKLKLMVDFQLFCSLHLKIYIYIWVVGELFSLVDQYLQTQEKELVESALSNVKQKVEVLELSLKSHNEEKSTKSGNVLPTAKPQVADLLSKFVLLSSFSSVSQKFMFILCILI